MNKYDAILFDHDGTIVDSAPGILSSANAAFEALGYPAMNMKEFMPFLGPPLQNSFIEFVGMAPEEAERAVEIYRRAYSAGNCFILEIYDGMEALLRKLRAAGIKTAVASSKPTVFLEKVLCGLRLRDLFDAVCGTQLDRLHGGKDDIIAEAARQCGVPPERCLMVGDRRFDVEGAQALGMPCAGMLYGYGSRAELETAGADFLAESCWALEQLLLHHS